MKDTLKSILLLSLVATLTHARIGDNTCRNGDTSCVARAYGYSPSCVVATLSICEETTQEYAIQKDLKSLVNSLNQYSKSPSSATEKSRVRHCADLKNQGDASGVRTIYPHDSMPKKPVVVYCDQTTDRGGWTVIQRREDLQVRENFERSWVEYALGFGKVDKEFWLGLHNIHALTSNQLMELRVNLEDWDNLRSFAVYRYFHVGDTSSKYQLSIGGYHGDAGDSMVSEFEGFNHDGKMFSTFDNDNDMHNTSNCAVTHNGAWWYDKCHSANLNGLPVIGNAAKNGEGISWHTFKGTFYSLKKVAMMVRPASFKK